MTSWDLECSLDRIGEEQKKGKTYLCASVHFHLLEALSTFRNLFTLFHSYRSVVSDTNFSHR